MYRVCMSFIALSLTCLLVLAAFCYSQMVRSDGLKLKCWALNLTVATGWLLFQIWVLICPTVMVQNYIMYRKGLSVS